MEVKDPQSEQRLVEALQWFQLFLPAPKRASQAVSGGQGRGRGLGSGVNLKPGPLRASAENQSQARQK
jgi:hypothetical protein